VLLCMRKVGEHMHDLDSSFCCYQPNWF